MICPHCEYRHGYNDVDNEDKIKIGEEGDFYRLPINLTRDTDSYVNNLESAALIGCPSCSKTFIYE